MDSTAKLMSNKKKKKVTFVVGHRSSLETGCIYLPWHTEDELMACLLLSVGFD